MGLFSSTTSSRYSGAVLVIFCNLDFEQNAKGVNYVLKRARKAAVALKGRMAVAVARLMEWHAIYLNGRKEPSLTVYGIGTLTKDFGMDISKAKELLGYEPGQTVKDAIDEFINWYKTQPA